jgi:hypothetical protein
MRLRRVMNLFRIGLMLAGLVLPGLTWMRAAQADEVSDQIEKARGAWANHDAQQAIAALDEAGNLLRQMRADSLKKALPVPPPGWTADPAETSSVSAAMLGGGTTASRVYRQGDQQVEIDIMTDSPMLQGMAALINSPLAASAGIKAVTVGGRTVSYTQSDNGYMTLVGDKIIVKVEGNKQTPEPTVRSFVAAIDFDAVENLAH